MSDTQQAGQHENGNGHGDTGALATRLEAMEPHPHLLAQGFPGHRIQQAGWRVEKLGDAYQRYGLPEAAADCEVWLIPYLHPNGQVWFVRAHFIHDEDRARFGTPDAPRPELYDPFLILSSEHPGPRDSVLLVEGEANTVAADMLIPAFGAVGIAEGSSLSARMASYLGHIPCVYLWLDRQQPGHADSAQWMAERLREAGVHEIRQLSAPMTAVEALRELGPDQAIEPAEQLLAKAEIVEAPTDEDWPLMPRPTPPPFPLDALPPTLADLVRAVSMRERTPPDMAAMAALGVLSAVAMNAKIDCGGWEEDTLTLYALVVSPSGDQKSTVLKRIAAPLYRLERELREAAKVRRALDENRVEVLQARKRALLRKVEKLQEEDELQAIEADLEEISAELNQVSESSDARLLTDDATPEGLAKLMAKHPNGMAVVSAESAIVNNLLGHYSEQGKANLHVVCKAFNGEGPISIDRGGAEPLFILRPLLSITLFAQPHVLKGVLGHGTARDQGLVGRFIYSDVEPVSTLGHRDYRQEPPKVPHAVLEAWDQIVQKVRTLCRAADIAPNPPLGVSDNKRSSSDVEEIRLSLSPSSRKLLVDLLVALEPRKREGADLRPFADWLARHHGRIARIAALLHLTQYPPEQPIALDTMAAALRIGEYLLEHALIALSAPDPLIRRTLGWLSRRDADQVSQRDIYRGPLGSRGNADSASSLAQRLVEYGALRPVEPDPPKDPLGRGRRPSPRYEVNPRLKLA